MAGRLSVQEVDLSCPICCEVFKDPVVLKCSHSFCAACLRQYWGTRGSLRDCPLCRTLSVDEPVASLTLKNLCDAYVQEGDGPEAAAGAELYCDPGQMCPLHGEKLKLFCLQDREPICVVCHTSKRHKQHECCPVAEAIVDVKEEIKSALGSLREKREAFDKMKKNYEETVAYIQVQAQVVERRTCEEFEKLHQFLQAEEEARMELLREEQEEKSCTMRRKIEDVDRSLTSLSDSIRALEEDMASADISLLHKCSKTMASTHCSIEDPALVPGALIDVAKYLGSLKFTVWEKMHNIVEYTPVTLDPNTAAPWLLLSDDLTSVSDSDDKRKLPNNPERFDPDAGVMGNRGFTSGTHVWDVEVGVNTAWVVGVAKESVERKKNLSSVLKNGYLCVYFYHNMYFAGTSPLTRLSLKRNPQRIRVQLDCEKGRVSFYDPADGSHIYTFKHTLTEQVFPYFWVGCQKCPLKIEPLKVSVNKAVCE